MEVKREVKKVVKRFALDNTIALLRYCVNVVVCEGTNAGLYLKLKLTLKL